MNLTKRGLYQVKKTKCGYGKYIAALTDQPVDGERRDRSTETLKKCLVIPNGPMPEFSLPDIGRLTPNWYRWSYRFKPYMYWDDLSFWHDKAVKITKAMRGGNNGGY